MSLQWKGDEDHRVYDRQPPTRGFDRHYAQPPGVSVGALLLLTVGVWAVVWIATTGGPALLQWLGWWQ